jgi:hypothetical protein
LGKAPAAFGRFMPRVKTGQQMVVMVTATAILKALVGRLVPVARAVVRLDQALMVAAVVVGAVTKQMAQTLAGSDKMVQFVSFIRLAEQPDHFRQQTQATCKRKKQWNFLSELKTANRLNIQFLAIIFVRLSLKLTQAICLPSSLVLSAFKPLFLARMKRIKEFSMSDAPMAYITMFGIATK